MSDGPAAGLTRYEPSGRTGALGLLAPVLVAVPAALAGWLYSLFDVYVPVAGGVTLLALFGVVVLGAAAAASVLKFCRVRNRTLATATGALAGLAAWYAAWAAFVAGVIRHANHPPATLVLLADPVRLGRDVLQIAREGAFTVMDVGIKGVVAWIVWATEAAAFLAGIPLLTRAGFASEVFCEACGRWAVKSRKPLERGLPAEDPLALLGAGVRALLEASPAEAGDRRLRFTLRSCPSCGHLHTLTLNAVTRTKDAKGKVSTSSKELIENAVISAFDAALIEPARASGAA